MSIIVCFINYFNYSTYFFILMCIIQIIAIIYCGLNRSFKQEMVSDTESPTLKPFVDIAGSYHSKILPIPGDVCTTISANDPPQKVQSTIFAPLQVEHRGATEPHIRPKAYLTDAQLNDPSDSGSGHVYQTGAGPKHGES